MNVRNTVIAAAAALGLSTAGAYAVPISGQISLGGYAQANGSVGMGGATGISFANASGSSVSGTSGVLTSFGAGSGSFAALGACSSTTTGCGSIKNITSFAAIPTSGNTPTISSFLTLSNGTGPVVTFDLNSLTSVTRNQDNLGGSLTFTAAGTINYSGFDATAGQFILTAQGNNIVSFSATTLSTAVPEPMSLALLGGSLAAVGLIRRKKSVAA